MMRGVRRAAAIVGCLGFAVWLPSDTALSHDWNDYYIGVWATEASPGFGLPKVVIDVDYFANGSGWTIARQDRVEDGAEVWDGVTTGRYFNFEYLGTTNGLPRDCTADANGLFWTSIDGTGGILARSTLCSAFGTMVRSWIEFDTAETWYTGTSSSVPSGEIDLYGAATHEFAHMSGWFDHFSGGTLCPNTSADHTMCPTMGSGEGYFRTLETHDIDTFQDAYG